MSWQEIAGLNDPVVRNLCITQRYHELAVGLRDADLGQDATWCAFAGRRKLIAQRPRWPPRCPGPPTALPDSGRLRRLGIAKVGNCAITLELRDDATVRGDDLGDPVLVGSRAPRANPRDRAGTASSVDPTRSVNTTVSWRRSEACAETSWHT